MAKMFKCNDDARKPFRFQANLREGHEFNISKLRQWSVGAAVVLLALGGAIVVLLDWCDVQGAVVQADWRPILFGLGVTGGSYAVQSYSFGLLNRSFGVRLGLTHLLSIGFVSSVMIAAVGGMAGHSLRLVLMARRGVPVGDAVAPSLFHGYLESLVFFALIPAGLAYLAVAHPLPSGAAAMLVAGAAILGVAFAMTAVVFFVGRVRAVALRIMGLTWWLATRRSIERGLQGFEDTLDRGFMQLRSRPLELAVPLALIAADRLARLVVIWCCFQAFGGDVDPSVILTGFAIGVAMGVMSMIPGGLGVQEGSMVGAYHLMGVPVEQAVLVSLLFRLVYYMAPFAASLLFYRRVLSGDRLEQPT